MSSCILILKYRFVVSTIGVCYSHIAIQLCHRSHTCILLQVLQLRTSYFCTSILRSFWRAVSLMPFSSSSKPCVIPGGYETISSSTCVPTFRTCCHMFTFRKRKREPIDGNVNCCHKNDRSHWLPLLLSSSMSH